ncbi:MAG: methyl-accepting chemotaxis protein [Limisphaerales bacterium]
MHSWTISRRIVTGFAVLLALTAALGLFSLRQIGGLRKDILEFNTNTLPSVTLLGECSSLVRDNLASALQYTVAETDARRAELQQRVVASRDQVDVLFLRYERMFSDPEDRRRFEEVKRHRGELREALSELTRRSAGADQEKCLTELVVPAYERTVAALRASIDYNHKLGNDDAAEALKSADRSARLILLTLLASLLSAALLAWWLSSTSSRMLRSITDQIGHGASQTAAAAKQVATTSQSLSQGSSEQAASVEETSASLEEMSSMIKLTAENAQKAKLLASEAQAAAQTGSATMVEMTQAMSAIDASSAEVAKIVKNIDEIAFQTNILALNAAVEAARAGEAGAGFAVVADEVRSLAQRSAAAARETAEKIEAAIESSRNGSRSSSRVGETLRQIADKVSSTDTLVGDIANSAKEQAQGIQQIQQGIAQVDKVTQSNSASAEESASAAEELHTQAGALREIVDRLQQLIGGADARTVQGNGKTAPQRPSGKAARHVVVDSPLPSSTRKKTSTPTPSTARNLPASGRKAIPMPGDGHGGDAEDKNFRDF